MMILVSYDVSTIDKRGKTRLRKVAKICLNYGQRVQNSVFECLVDPAQWTQMRDQLVRTIDEDQDSLRFYFMGSKWKGKVEHIGAKKSIDMDGPLII